MKAGTKRALIKLMCFSGLMILLAIIYGIIIGCVAYFLGDLAGFIARVVTIILLAGYFGYLMVREENDKEKEEQK